MLFSVAAHLVEASQNKLVGERDFFCFLLLTHKKILIAEFLKSKFSTLCLSSEINCKAQKSSDTRKVVFVALETRQISNFFHKTPANPRTVNYKTYTEQV